jgi:hypothetical protein
MFPDGYNWTNPNGLIKKLTYLWLCLRKIRKDQVLYERIAPVNFQRSPSCYFQHSPSCYFQHSPSCYFQHSPSCYFQHSPSCYLRKLPQLFPVECYMENNFCLNCKNSFTDFTVSTNFLSLLGQPFPWMAQEACRKENVSFRAAFLSDDTVDNIHRTMLPSPPTSQREIFH